MVSVVPASFCFQFREFWARMGPQLDTKILFAELKRRNVYKVAVAYAVVSWLLIQAASIVLPAFDAPAWAMKVLLVALAVGFPLAIIFAWAFEITPEGIKLEKDVDRHQSIAHHTGRKLIGITGALALIAAGLFAFQLVRSKSQLSAYISPSVPTASGAPAAAAVATAISDKSIAVLPFDSLSDDKANAYFTEGIQDEILTRLAKVADLKVISRTSTQKYK